MADGKIVIDVQVNGNKLTSLVSDLKSLESVARNSASGFKSASEAIKNAGNNAKGGGDGFKSASDKVKEAGSNARNGGSGFKNAAEQVKEAGIISKTGGNGFKVSADLARQAGLQASQGGAGFRKAGEEAKAGGDKAGQGASGFEKLKNSIKNFSVGAIAFKSVSAGLDLMKSSLDKAIDRFDTLQRFPKVMQSLGHSSKDVAASTKLLSEGIEGLPTTLDTVVATTQKLTSMTGDLKTSTKLTLALNNAFLASGATTEEASRGLTQYTQMLSSGKVDLQSFKTLQETMPYAMQKTAESFGFAGASAQNDFYAALRDGQITFKDFAKRLIELNKGTNGFAAMAKKNSEGIRTSFANIVNAVAIGISNVIDAFDRLSKAVTGKTIAGNLDVLKDIIRNVFKVIVSSIDGVTPVIKGIINVLGFLKPVLDPLIHVIGSAVAGMIAFKAAVMALNVIKGIGGLVSDMVQAFLHYIVTAKTAEAETLTLGTAMSSLGTGGIGLLVGALAGLVSWLTQESEETKKAKEAHKEFMNSIDELHNSVSKGNEAYEDRRREIKATAEDNERLVKKIEELSAVENKTAAQKKELASAAQTLNSRIDGLNIVYDKATGTINMTADAIRKQIEVSKQAAEAEAAQQRMVEIAKKRLEIEDKEAELKKKHAEAIEEVNKKEELHGFLLDSNAIKSGLRKKIDEEAADASEKLKDAKTQLGEQEERLTGIIQSASEAQAKATEDSAGRQILTLETMDDTQRKLVDDMKSQYETMRGDVQNAFQAIEQQTALSADQMIANLQKNIDATEKWASNLEQLAKRGLDQGLIEQLRQAGPKAAEQTQALVNASDEQLGHLNQKWSEAGDKAKDGFLRGIKATGVELAPEVQAMVTAIGDEFRQALIDAGFDVKAREIPQKASEGVKSGKDLVTQAGSELAQAAQQGIAGIANTAFESGNQTSGQYAGGITNGSPAVQNATEGIKNASLGVLASLFGEAQAKGADVGNGMSTGIIGSTGSAQGASDQLKGGVTSVFAGMSQEGQQAGSNFTSGLSLALSVGQQVASGAASLVKLSMNAQFLTSNSDGQQAGSSFGSGVASGINSTQGQVNSASTSTKNTANNAVSSLGSDGQQAGSSFGSGTASGINGMNGSVFNAASNMRQSAENGTQGGYNAAYYAGTSIGEGLMSGIYAMAGSVAAAAASIAANAVAAAASQLKINSPSKVFRDKIGRAIPEGWALGIEKYSYYVDDSMKDLGNDIIDAGNALSGKISLTPESALGLVGSRSASYGMAGSVSNSSVTNNYTLNANGGSQSNFFTPENMRRLLREMAYYTNLEGGKMA